MYSRPRGHRQRHPMTLADAPHTSLHHQHQQHRRKPLQKVMEGDGVFGNEQFEGGEGQQHEDQYSYTSLSEQVEASLLKCNSPFLESIFGTPEKKHGQHSWEDRQKLAASILGDSMSVHPALHRGPLGRPSREVPSNAMTSGNINTNNHNQNLQDYTTTNETQSDISSISEMITTSQQNHYDSRSRSNNKTSTSSKRSGKRERRQGGSSRSSSYHHSGGIGSSSNSNTNIISSAAVANDNQPSRGMSGAVTTHLGVSTSAPLAFKNKENVTRIVAPNVEKLPPHSVVDVIIQGEETVSVLCSVDVLKMRSEYFFEHLSALEMKAKDALVDDLSTTSSAFGCPLLLDDDSPYEAAAYLESIHDGKGLSNDWSYNFCRLSVHWRVEDLIAESASIVDRHIETLLKTVERHHWRTNPSILAGSSVSLLFPRQEGGCKPEFVVGKVVEARGRMPYSCLRLSVEATDPVAPAAAGTGSNSNSQQASPRHSKAAGGGASEPSPPGTPPISTRRAAASSRLTPFGVSLSMMNDSNNNNKSSSSSSSSSSSNSIGSGGSDHRDGFPTVVPVASVFAAVSWNDFEISSSSSSSSSSSASSSHKPSEQDVTIDGGTSIYVQHKASGEWTDPDLTFVEDIKSLLAPTDGVFFWEMLKAVVELPRLQAQCKGRIQTAQHIVDVLTRREFRCLWQYNKGIPSFLPKKCALQLIHHAFGPANIGINSNK